MRRRTKPKLQPLRRTKNRAVTLLLPKMALNSNKPDGGPHSGQD